MNDIKDINEIKNTNNITDMTDIKESNICESSVSSSEEHAHSHSHKHPHNHSHEHHHGHEHEHHHDHGSEKFSVVSVIRPAISIALLVCGMILLKEYRLPGIIVCLAAYLLSGYDVIIEAVENILHLSFFDEEFLMTVASAGAFCIGEFEEAAAVMILFQIGEMLQDYAVGKSRKSIASLMNIRPDTARMVKDSSEVLVSPSEVPLGSEIIVNPGEKIPLDGTIVKGNSMLDTSALTGESIPREVAPGDSVLSGCINSTGVLIVKTNTLYENSTVNRILELVENAGSRKTKTENFITKFSRIYTPTVIGLAILLAFIPPLVLTSGGKSFTDELVLWLHRALSFLVVSCPCALIISVPLSYFAGLGAASGRGILIKGSNYLETLCNLDYVIWDKTGTLTKGVFAVGKVIPAQGFSENEVLKYANAAESHSSHPIAVAIRKYVSEKGFDAPSELVDITESAGYGIIASFNGKRILAGNSKLMESEGIVSYDREESGTVCYIAVQGKYAGCIIVEDSPKEESANAIKKLKETGICENIMLTGDNENAAFKIKKKLDIDTLHAGLLPEDKVHFVEEYTNKGITAFVGDGINDAPSIALSHLGVAMGGLGSDAAIEAADMVIMNDNPMQMVSAVRIARKTHRIATENIILAIVLKIAFLILISLGFVGMWAAVIADVGVCLLAILNALRCITPGRS